MRATRVIRRMWKVLRVCHSNEIEAFRADVSEAKAKLERLDEKLAEIESQKGEVNTAITQARHIAHIQKESTSVEVFRLKGESHTSSASDAGQFSRENMQRNSRH